MVPSRAKLSFFETVFLSLRFLRSPLKTQQNYVTGYDPRRQEQQRNHESDRRCIATLQSEKNAPQRIPQSAPNAREKGKVSDKTPQNPFEARSPFTAPFLPGKPSKLPFSLPASLSKLPIAFPADIFIGNRSRLTVYVYRERIVKSRPRR